MLVLMLLAAAPATDARPSVVLILADDLGPGDLGCYGGAGAETPNLDRLAATGTRFARYYSASPICSPSRAGLLTGQYPGRWRITSYLQTRAGNRSCDQADWLDVKAPSLGRAFRDAGYATAHFGKWHLGGGRDVTDAPPPQAYGYGESHVNFEGTGPRFANERGSGQVARHAMTAYWADKAIDFITRNRDRPFFVNFWPQDPHTPHLPATVEANGPPRSRCRAVVTELDRQVGRIIAALDRLGVAGRTAVVFTSDNGPEPTFDQARTGGLRGMKWSLYEGGLRVPLIVRYPPVVPVGRADESTVLTGVDVFPTLLGLCGLRPPGGLNFDGEDMSTALRGNTVARAGPIYWEYGRKPPPPDGKRFGPFPRPREPNAQSPNVAVRDGRWKLLVNADGTAAELYDLEIDPRESADVTNAQTEVAGRLKRMALEWRRSLP